MSEHDYNTMLSSDDNSLGEDESDFVMVQSNHTTIDETKRKITTIDEAKRKHTTIDETKRKSEYMTFHYVICRKKLFTYFTLKSSLIINFLISLFPTTPIANNFDHSRCI
jgi:hypothetical protein